MDYINFFLKLVVLTIILISFSGCHTPGDNARQPIIKEGYIAIPGATVKSKWFCCDDCSGGSCTGCTGGGGPISCPTDWTIICSDNNPNCP